MPTTVTGTLQSISGGAISSGSVTFTLVNYGGSVPYVSGTALLVAPLQVSATADGSGNFSISVYSNDSITPSTTFYQVNWSNSNGVSLGSAGYLITGSSPVNLNSLSPISSVPVAIPPTADTIYARLDASNGPFTNPITTPGLTINASSFSFNGKTFASPSTDGQVAHYNGTSIDWTTTFDSYYTFSGYNPTGTLLYWLTNHYDHSGVIINRNAVVSGGDFDSGVLVHRQYLTGGSYGATQPAIPGVNVDQRMTTKGQNVAVQSNIEGYGIGNTMYAGGLLEGYGGAGSLEVSPGSVPLIGSEIDYYVGSAVANESTFQATVSSVNTNTFIYSSPTNEFNIGERWFLIPSRIFSGTAVSISGTTVTVSGSDTLTSDMVGKYFMLGTQVAYASPCSGLDADIDSVCWPLMYRISAIDNVAKTITLMNYYDQINYATSGSYLIVNGAVASGVNASSASVTVDNATSLGAQDGDVVYSPPNPWQGMTDQKVYRHKWLIGKNSINSGAMTFNNIGAKKDTLFHAQGNWNYFFRADSMTEQGIDWFDLHNATASHSALWIAQSDGTTNRLCFGNSNCDGQISYLGNKLQFITGPSGSPFVISDAANDWVLQFQRIAAGIVGIGNGDTLDYGCGTTGVWLKRAAGLSGAIDICSGSAGVVINNQPLTGMSNVSGSGNFILATSPTITTPSISGNLTLGSVAFASLGTPANGVVIYCSDCTIASPCAGSGTGALAKRLNGTWVCN